MFSVDEIITGDSFQELADATVAIPFKVAFHTVISERIKERLCVITPTPTGGLHISPEHLAILTNAKIIFVYSDLLAMFFQSVMPAITHPFVLISHNSDDIVDAKFAPFLDNPNLLRWYAMSVHPVFSHPKIVCIPAGMGNRQWPHGRLELVANPPVFTAKSILMYANFRINTNLTSRNYALETISKNPDVFVETGISFEQYVQRLQASRFVISPPGNAIEAHRHWESMYMGAVPVMLSQDKLECLNGLPILEIDAWESLPRLNLTSIWEDITRSSWHIERLYMSYWKRRIEGEFLSGPEIKADRPDQGQQNMPVIFVCTEATIPASINQVLLQARLFTNGEIILVTRTGTVWQEPLPVSSQITLVALEQLGLSAVSQSFMDFALRYRDTPHRPLLKEAERFFILQSLMQQQGLRHVLHLASDMGLYFDPALYAILFQSYGKAIAAPFDNSQSLTPKFAYFRDAEGADSFAKMLLAHLQGLVGEPQALTYYRHCHEADLAILPTLPPSDEAPLRRLDVLQGEDIALYGENFDPFRALFDTGALGQAVQQGQAAAYGIEKTRDVEGRDVYVVRTESGLWRINVLQM